MCYVTGYMQPLAVHSAEAAPPFVGAGENTSQPTSLSATGKRWVMRGNETTAATGRKIATTLSIPLRVGEILAGRGFATAEDVLKLLSPKLSDLPDPLHLRDMDKAVERLIQAINTREKIAVFGDYDVDGSCGAALLARYIRAVGGDVFIYIPDRITEGYGPNAAAMDRIYAQGATLLVTTDCGSLAFPAFGRAKEIGLDVIVTDHHQTQPLLPPVLAVVNPNRVDETSDCRQLSGAGVAFFLIMAVNRALRTAGFFKTIPEPKLKELLDLVAVATICDMVPLTGVNRALVCRGLDVLAQHTNKGLAALMQSANLSHAASGVVGFAIGPRINAGGRVGACNIGAKLLATDDEADATDMAQTLNLLNEERKSIEQAVQAEALSMAAAQANNSCIVVNKRGWHPGVIGIVAARIKEKYNRPTFVIATTDDGLAKGSGRSVEGIDLGQAVLNCKDVLINGGGHTMAAGITLTEKNIPDFHALLTEKINTQIEKYTGKSAAIFTPKLKIDAVLTPVSANLELAEILTRLAPFGIGNPEPRFALHGVNVRYAKAVGADGKHVKCTLTDATGTTLDAIAFSAMESAVGALLLNPPPSLSVCGTLQVNSYMGREKASFVIEDVAV